MRQFELVNIISKLPALGGFYNSGQSVEEVLFIYGLKDENCIIHVNDKIVSDKYILDETERLRIDIIPRGGDTKNTLFGILALATGGMTASLLGRGLGLWKSGSLWHTLASTMTASALSKKWISSPQVIANDIQRDEAQSLISSQSNEYRLNQKVPVVLGHVKYAPPKAALDFAEISGNDYYYNILLCPGYGRLDISEIKIGETSIDDYSDVTVSVVDKKDSDTLFAYFNKDVYEESVGTELTTADWTTRTTQSETDQISIDLSFPEGLITLNENNEKAARAVELYLEYKKSSDANWLTFQNSINLQMSEGIEAIDAEVTKYETDYSEFIQDDTDPDVRYIINY